MTEELRKEQTDRIYNLKMWERCVMSYQTSGIEDDTNYMSFIRVPGGWVVEDCGSICFIPIRKEKDINTLDTPKVRI